MNSSRWLRRALLALLVSVMPLSALAQHYVQTNLVSDLPQDVSGATQPPDPDLKNAWGMSRTATSPWWVSDNGTGKATLYNAAGVKQGLVVTIATPTGDSNPATPTGQVANGTTGFVVDEIVNNVKKTGAARFIFATEDGTISGWNPAVDGTHSIIKVNNAGSAIYKGLAILTTTNGTFLYAANFVKDGKVDVFDSTWTAVTNVSFVDPSLPPGYAPFNVQALGSSIFVAFAKLGDPPDEQQGKGLGYVDEFDASGNILRRFEHGPWLNAPWGMAIAPASGFGEFSGAFIVGNFGSGRLVAYDRNSGAFLGFLHSARGPLVIDGLWGIAFGNAGNNGTGTQLFFTAGPNDEQHGLFGFLTAKPEKGDDDSGDND